MFLRAFCLILCIVTVFACSSPSAVSIDGDLEQDFVDEEEFPGDASEEERDTADNADTADTADRTETACECGPESGPCCDGCHWLSDGQACDDNHSQTDIDTCQQGICIGIAGTCTDELDGVPCDDNSPETSNDRCAQGICLGHPVACGSQRTWLACDDGQRDTARDICLPDGRCVGVPIETGLTCDENCGVFGYCADSALGGTPACFQKVTMGLGDGIQKISLSKDGSLLAIAYAHNVHIRRMSDFAIIREMPLPDETATTIAIAPDNSTVAIGVCMTYDEDTCIGSQIHVLDVASQQVVSSEKIFEKWLHSLAYSPDGSLLAAGGCIQRHLTLCMETAIHLLDPATAQITGTIPCRDTPPLELAFSPDGRYVVGQEDGVLYVYSVAGTSFIRYILAPPEEPNDYWIMSGSESIIFSPDGSLIGHAGCIEMEGLNYCQKSRVVLWRFDTGELYGTYEIALALQWIALTSDASTLIGIAPNSAALWDVSSGDLKETISLVGYGESAIDAAFDAHTSRLVIGRGSGRSNRYEVTQPGNPSVEVVSVLGDYGGEVIDEYSGGTVLLEGNYAAISPRRGYDGNHLVKWRVKDGEELRSADSDSSCGGVTAINPNRTMLAQGCSDGTVAVFSTATLARLHTLSYHEASVDSLAFSPDGQWLASGDDDGVVLLQRTDDFENKVVVGTGFGRVWAIGFSQNRSPSMFAAARCKTLDGNNCGSSEIQLYSRVESSQTWSEHSTIDNVDGSAWSLAFSPDGKHLAYADRSVVAVVDLNSPGNRDTIELPFERLISAQVQFSSDGKWLYYSAGNQKQDGNVYVWDVIDKSGAGILHLHEGGIHWLDLSADGKLLITGSEDNSTTIATFSQSPLIMDK